MLQKFFETTIESTFVKSIIYNTPLPLFDTIGEGDYMIKGAYYIIKHDFVLCTQSGTYKDPTINVGNYSMGSTLSDSSDSPKAEYRLIRHYSFNQHIRNITKRHISSYSYYDGETHKYLGDYLRCLRDIFGLNLMSMYNCFTYEMMQNVQLTLDKNNPIILENTESSKVVAIPIKFNKIYTIVVDSDLVIAYPVLISDKSILLDSTREAVISKNFQNFSLRTYSDVTFSHPVTYKLECTDLNIYNNQKFLNLLIQLPASNTSSLVVLEGDYSSKGAKTVISGMLDPENQELVTSYEVQKLSELYAFDNSLLKINDGSFYAFGSKLIEYLVHNVVTNMDFISENIMRVQEYIDPNNTIGYVKGVWSPLLRCLILNKYNKTIDSFPKVDITGFVDSDIEYWLKTSEPLTTKYYVTDTRINSNDEES